MNTHRVTAESAAGEDTRLLRAEKIMVHVRWVATVFALAQVLTFYLPYPPHVLKLALASVAAMAIGNTIFTVLVYRGPSGTRLQTISVASLAFELVSAQAIIWTYTFDPATAIWAIMYLLPLAGAIRFQRRGAMAVTAAASFLYVLRDLYGAAHYNFEFLLTSVTFRCGIALLIAWVAGTSTLELLNGRRAVERVNQDLTDLNRSMREFVSIASHDMRTPVSVISGLSHTISRDGDDMSEEQKRELIGVIYRRSQSLDRLVNDLLATSSIDAGILPCRPESVALDDLLHDVAQHESSSHIDVTGDPDCRAYADAEHIRRIVGNLLVNAQRYGAEPIGLSTQQLGPWVRISVTDSGPGVPTAFVPRLFEKFARAPETARQIEGTGLGLSIVKGLALQNGGSVSYERTEHGAAAFSVTLPASNTSDESRPA